MDSVNVLYEDDSGNHRSISIQRIAIKCPFCKMHMIPQFMYLCIQGQDKYNVFCQCTNPECEHSFVSEYRLFKSEYVFTCTAPNASMEIKSFSEIIQGISPSFCEIYNQAYAAQQMNLFQICGVGYRKALEFLIKDYVMSLVGEDEKAGIMRKNLSQCINENINNQNIKSVAERAVWIGNDETHYMRKWETKDVGDLTVLIELTIHWIESEVETKRILEEMPKL